MKWVVEEVESNGGCHVPASPTAHGRHAFETLFSHIQPLRTNNGNNRRVTNTPEALNRHLYSTERQSAVCQDA